MKKAFLILIFISGAVLPHVSSGDNVLLMHNNKPLDYTKVDAAVIRNAANITISSCDEKIRRIANPAGNITVANTLYAYDEIQYELSDLLSRLGLIAATFTDGSIRDTAFSTINTLQLYANNIYLNAPLYKVLSQFQTTIGAQLSPEEKKFIDDVIISFEKNGMKLDEKAQKELSSINQRIIETANTFDKNIAESRDSVSFTAGELKGMPANDIEPWKQADGTYTVTVNFPNYTKIIENAESGIARKRMYVHYNNRAWPENLSVLDSLLYYRDEYAKKLGFSSFAAYAVVDKMASTPGNVWAFQQDLVNKLNPLVTAELAALKKQKKDMNPSEADTFYAWDYSYYSKKLLNTRYKLNPDEVKEYFEMNNTLEGMFRVYEHLLGIEIKATANVPVWEKKVKTYDMYKDGIKTGSFYLDLYPRPGKYTHFMCNPISQFKKDPKGDILPEAALVCNFPEGTSSQPSLLKQSDVITLFHEFGHLVHWLLCHPQITSQHSFGTKGDFVEAPSQFLENWCYEYDALKMFAKHYKTGEIMPRELFDKLKASQKFNSGSYYVRQVSLGMIDFTFEDKYDETRKKGLMQVAREQFSLMQMPFPEGSHSICSFGHLSGYAANYYGYLWSRVFAQDMFSVFKEVGVMDRATGIRYRKEVLEKGSSAHEQKLVENFLKRESNSKAFLESLGVN